MASKNVRIRYFRPSDAQDVMDVFLDAQINAHSDSIKTRAFSAHRRSTTALLQYFTTVIGLSISLLPTSSIQPVVRWLGIALAIGAAGSFLVHHHGMERAIAGYIDACFQEDMADIAMHYGMVSSGEDGEGGEYVPKGHAAFWVAELVPVNSDLNPRPQSSAGAKIIGCVGLDYTMQNPDGIYAGELRRMVVAKEYRRRGIGKMLVERVVSRARERRLGAVWLSTTGYHAPAAAMYRKCGWVEVGRSDLVECLFGGLGEWWGWKGWSVVVAEQVVFRLGLTYN